MASSSDSAVSDIQVWLVEDESHYRQTFAYLVDHTPGMRCVKTFAHCEALITAMADRSGFGPAPDVILMDIHLPGQTGIACVSELKARLPQTQFVMLTISDEEDLIFSAFRAGASGYLLKNAPLDVILGAIRSAFQGGMLVPPQLARRLLTFFAQEIPGGSHYGLTDREHEVLTKMVEGKSQKQIASDLFVSPSTVNGHIQHIYEKLHVHSSSAAVAKALRERLV